MWILYILIALIVIVLVLGMIAPKEYQVQRSTTIKLPLSKVYDYLKYLRNQDEWSPWQRRDPSLKSGATARWLARRPGPIPHAPRPQQAKTKQ